MRALSIASSLLAFTSLLACAQVGNLFESAQMKRAKEFISVSEYESARTELRVQLHNSPEDREAKALLLFIRLAEVGSDAAAGCLISATPASAASTSAEEAQKELRLKLRKAELDAGIPTKDWEEYRDVLAKAVTYGWTEHDFPPDALKPRLVFAFCAAANGDPTGMAYLVDHLASEDLREDSKSLLYLVGDAAIPSLTAVANSSENLAKGEADQTLRNLRLAGLIAKLSSENTNRVSPTTVRTDGSSRNQSAGKFLMGMGWEDANEGLEPVFQAAKVRASLNQLGQEDDSAPIMLRRATVGSAEVVFATVALPASSNTEEAAADGLQPAGINTTFLSRAWRWNGEDWAPLTIDSKPSISGPDLAVLRITGPPAAGAAGDGTVGPDQLSVRLYRGIQRRVEYVDYGWYGPQERIVTGTRVDQVIYHLGAAGLEKVKTTNLAGLEVDANGVVLSSELDEYEGEGD
jgi:hypothetical protein